MREISGKAPTAWTNESYQSALEDALKVAEYATEQLSRVTAERDRLREIHDWMGRNRSFVLEDCPYKLPASHTPAWPGAGPDERDYSAETP